MKTHNLQSSRRARVGRQVPRTLALDARNEPVVRRQHELAAAHRECECHKVVHDRGAVIHCYNLCRRKLIKNERVWLVVQIAIKNEVERKKVGEELRTESEGHSNILIARLLQRNATGRDIHVFLDHASGRLSKVLKVISVGCGDASPGPSREHCCVD